MTIIDQADHLLVIRLNNFAAIDAAYGHAAARAAMAYLHRAAERHLGRLMLRRMEGDEIECTARCAVMRGLPLGTQIDALCCVLSADPFRCGDADILLSVSAGYASAADVTAKRSREAWARLRLAASPVSDASSIRSEEDAVHYRKDMDSAVRLLSLVRRGGAFISWRPVSRPQDPTSILYHEAMLRRVGDRGEQMDCTEAYAAMERLGLAQLLDRQMISDVLDELESDLATCLSVAISSRSLSLNLHGEGAGWTDLFDRLRKEPSLGRRLVVEIADNSGIAFFRDALAFVRALRELGVRISVARFGSGHASIGQLLALAPDVVKLDSPFMHAAYESQRNQIRVRHLLGLARTVSPTVIVDGIESPWHLHLALDEGVEWVAGSHLGRPSLRRGWLNAGYSDSIASLDAFSDLFDQQARERAAAALR